jgi:hypothetical protein
MMTSVRLGSAVTWSWLLAVVTLLLAGACLAQAPNSPQASKKLPEGVSEVKKQDLLTKVPNFFYFDYNNEPQPGKRLWLRVDDQHWIERYPDGTESKFKILGRMLVAGELGTVVVKTAGDPNKTNTPNDGSFYVFVPDKGNAEMVIRTSRMGLNQLSAPSAWVSDNLQKVE